MARAAREEGEGGTDLRQVDFSPLVHLLIFSTVFSRERIVEHFPHFNLLIFLI